MGRGWRREGRGRRSCRRVGSTKERRERRRGRLWRARSAEAAVSAQFPPGLGCAPNDLQGGERGGGSEGATAVSLRSKKRVESRARRAVKREEDRVGGQAKSNLRRRSATTGRSLAHCSQSSQCILIPIPTCTAFFPPLPHLSSSQSLLPLAAISAEAPPELQRPGMGEGEQASLATCATVSLLFTQLISLSVDTSCTLRSQPRPHLIGACTPCTELSAAAGLWAVNS